MSYGRSVKRTFHYNAKPLALGRRIGLHPQRDHFRVGDTDMLVFKKPGGPNATPNLPILPSVPNARQWNIPCVGYARVKFVFLSLFLARWVHKRYPTRTKLSVEYGLKEPQTRP